MKIEQPVIMVIDDVKMNVSLLKGILTKNGFEVVSASDAKSAFELLEKSVPDLILLDIMMPEMDGISFCKTIKQYDRLKDIPVIFLTALNNLTDIVKGFKAGGVDYVTKPFYPDELIARINTHLRKRNIEYELNKVNTAKDRLFSIISHDLRGNVGYMMNILQALSSETNDMKSEEMKIFLESLTVSSQEIYYMLEDLLSWTKTQQKSIMFQPDFHNVFDIAEDTVALFSQMAEKKEIEIKNEITKTLEGYFDKSLIVVVFRNLLSNAVKFTKTGGHILIYSKIHNKFLEISIKDTGVGILEDNINYLFTENANISTRGTLGEKGTGLGLEICKDFVEKNGGRIKVESAPGAGSTFIFTLPLSKI